MPKLRFGENESSKLILPVVLSVLLVAGTIRYATEHFGNETDVKGSTPSSSSIVEHQDKSHEQLQPNKPEANAVNNPAVESSKKKAPAATSALVEAIRVEQGLFTDVRIRENVICAADYPFLAIGEMGNEFVALNGIARQWANKNYLSVYRNGQWIAVSDRGVTPFNLGISEAQNLIKIARDLCPSSSTDMLEEMAAKMKEGEARFAQFGSKFRRHAVERTQSSPAPKKDVDDDAIEVVAWYLAEGWLGHGWAARETQVGNKIRTTGGMSCFRFDDHDYRCVKRDSSHGKVGVLIASNIDGPEKQVIDEHCVTLARGLNDLRCKFNVTMIVEKRSTDHLETTFFYFSDRMKLTRWSKY
jgi:hypothetical protein